MVTFKHKETGREKVLPDRFAEGILKSAEIARGYELVETKKQEEPKKTKEGLIEIRKGGQPYKDLIKLATDKQITMQEIEEKYSISANVKKEIEVLLK